MGVIDEVKQKTDIVDVIGQHASLKKAGRNLTALCPFHSERHSSFFVYPEQQSWHCFGACNTGGDVFSFIMKKEGIDFGEALRLLAQRAGVTVPSRFEREEGKGEKEELYQINEAATQYFHNLLLNAPAAEKARTYVAGRGFSQKTISDFQLGFSLDSWESLKQYLLERGHAESALITAGLLIEAENGRTHDRFRGRLMFPIRDARGHTIGFGARVLDDSLPKYLNSPQTPLFDKSSVLYGIELAAQAIRQQDMAVIVEGYIDVITAHQNNITNVVASMGTSVTQEDKDHWRAYNEPAERKARRAGVERSEEASEKQINTLKRLTKNVILALDADAAGEEAMLRSIRHENTLNAEVRVIILPEGKDPDDVIKEDAGIWQGLVEKAIPIVDYTFNMVTSKLDLATARGQTLAVEKLGPIVLEIKNSVRQAHYLQKLARITDKSMHIIEEEINRMRPAPVRHRIQEAKQGAITSALRPYVSSPLEADCLTLLLKHPELKASSEDLSPEFFKNIENREVFIAWQQTGDLSSLREKLDWSLHEHLDSLINKDLPSTQVEQRYADYTCRLRERFLKNLEAKRAEIFALEAEAGGIGADLAKLEQEGIEPSIQLRDVFTRKSQRRTELRR